jgi:hypothetical protein
LYTPVISALGRSRVKNSKFEAHLSYIVTPFLKRKEVTAFTWEGLIYGSP